LFETPACFEDRAARDQRRRGRLPGPHRVRWIQIKGVPLDRTRHRGRHPVFIARTNHAMAVPVVHYPRVGHDRLRFRECLGRIGRQHRKPDGVDLNLQIGIRLKQRILNPLGAAQAPCSCWGNEDDEPRYAAVLVELLLQFTQDVDAARRSAAQRAARREHREKKNDSFSHFVWGSGVIFRGHSRTFVESVL